MTSYKTYTPEEIIAAYSNDSKKSRITYEFDSKKIGDSSVIYIPVRFIDSDGKITSLQIKACNQVVAYGAKAPVGSQNEKVENAKFMNITFKTLLKEELKDSDHKEVFYSRFLENNETFIKALDLIISDYENNVIEKLKGDKVPDRVREKAENPKTSNINSPRQSLRNATKSEKEDPSMKTKIKMGKLPIQYPLYRFRLPIVTQPQNMKTLSYGKQKIINENLGKIGKVYEDRSKKSFFINVVFDSRKKMKDTKGDSKKESSGLLNQVATFRDSPLTKETAGNFLTSMSLATLIIDFESVCFHQFGISLIVSVKTIFVYPHKLIKRIDVNDQELDLMNSMGPSGYDENDVVDEPAVVKKKVMQDSDNDDDDEPERNVRDEPEREEKVSKKSSKSKAVAKLAAKATKPAAKATKPKATKPAPKQVESDPDTEETDEAAESDDDGVDE